MAVTYKKGPGVYRISPEACVYIANLMWAGKDLYGLSPGTIYIYGDRMEYCKFGLTLGVVPFGNTPLSLSKDGVLLHLASPEQPECSQAQIWAMELMHA